ncbi:response regulator [Pseudochryseolinea flava]|uniref:Response regulatory domain-containing protein n=1 Tax=Pseudochryseolinea flava TaxID=2059302 RepID=A0A364Y6I3_9BACT|nr:response regulator [Pseudochryseolinea flava]RAW02017.1 hypothetical protein DQQ10_05530 [Pseudochryseolinea flava]
MNIRIVNVDDDQDDRDLFCHVIQKIDPEIQCIQIDSGEEAVEMLSRNEIIPDYIFMDINMPRMNGYECVKEIHHYSSLRNTTIVMYSSTFNPRDQVDFALLGLKYLLKTSDLNSLIKSISDLIGSKSKTQSVI